jgi:acetyl-CoA carboxylase alpha subunit
VILFSKLHGDRNILDDKAMIGGLGKIEDQSFMFIGTQKGYNTKTRQYRNFGMANPEGYRKALRLMKSADKFGIPIVTFIDTPGAFPGLEAEGTRSRRSNCSKYIRNDVYFSTNYSCDYWRGCFRRSPWYRRWR